MVSGHLPEVMIMPGEARVAGSLTRLARLLLGRNALRRPSDRIEGAILVVLLAAFGVAVAAASVFGTRIYHSQRAGAAVLRPAVAVLTRTGPGDSLGGEGQALAQWRAPDGRREAGTLTLVTAPDIWDATAGSRVPVWLTPAGAPAAPPPSRVLMVFNASLVAIWAACGAGMALAFCYWLCRRVLDRRRLAAWESAWALTGPRWTSRR
jgi:hypothetical protein